MAALPAKQRPATMAILGTRPDSWAKLRKVGTSSPATAVVSVSPGRPPPPSANQTTGSFWSAMIAISRSDLRWFIAP